MNIYEKCVKQEAILHELEQKMKEARDRYKLVEDEAFEYRERLDIPPNVERLNSLNKRSTKALKEFIRLGKQRIEAADDWYRCLHAHNSN